MPVLVLLLLVPVVPVVVVVIEVEAEPEVESRSYRRHSSSSAAQCCTRGSEKEVHTERDEEADINEALLVDALDGDAGRRNPHPSKSSGDGEAKAAFDV